MIIMVLVIPLRFLQIMLASFLARVGFFDCFWASVKSRLPKWFSGDGTSAAAVVPIVSEEADDDLPPGGPAMGGAGSELEPPRGLAVIAESADDEDSGSDTIADSQSSSTEAFRVATEPSAPVEMKETTFKDAKPGPQFIIPVRTKLTGPNSKGDSVGRSPNLGQRGRRRRSSAPKPLLQKQLMERGVVSDLDEEPALDAKPLAKDDTTAPKLGRRWKKRRSSAPKPLGQLKIKFQGGGEGARLLFFLFRKLRVGVTMIVWFFMQGQT